MKQLVILSGKGGTGKTTVSSAFITLAGDKAFADCDVDAPNLHILFDKYIEANTKNFYGYKKAVKYEDICTQCGTCEKLCRFGAIKDGKINPYECEGCGLCEAFCPAVGKDGKKAVRLQDNVSGKTYLYRSKEGVFSSAELEMGNGASGKLVTEVRKNLYNSVKDEELVIIDGSPGIGCPVIASITGSDMVLIVTEPTISGIHDMLRILDTVSKFGTACMVCVNKFDINISVTENIIKICKERNVPFTGTIPYDTKVIEALNEGKTVVKLEQSNAKDAIVDIWDKVFSALVNT